jgi:recombination endonuclease VII
MPWKETPAQVKSRLKYRSTVKGKLTARNAYLRHTFGIDNADYDRMLLHQKGLCAICSRPCPTGKRLAVDHCHKTHKVRGLLCAHCNRNLGWLEPLENKVKSYMLRTRYTLAGYPKVGNGKTNG